MAKLPTKGQLEGAEEESAWLVHAQEYFRKELQPRFQVINPELCVGKHYGSGQARFFSDVRERGYPDIPGWTFGTMDIMARTELGGFADLGPEDTLYVADWKTGGIEGAEEQLLSLLDASLDAFDQATFGTPGKLIISVLQVTQDGVRPIERTVELDEVIAHGQAMSWQWERLQDASQGPPGPEPGIHCTQLYCPHLAYCDAISGAVRAAAEADQLISQENLLKKLTDQPVDNEEAAGTIELVTAAKRQLTYLTECMKEWVRNNGPIVSGDWKWGPTESGFRWRKRK